MVFVEDITAIQPELFVSQFTHNVYVFAIEVALSIRMLCPSRKHIEATFANRKTRMSWNILKHIRIISYFLLIMNEIPKNLVCLTEKLSYDIFIQSTIEPRQFRN